MQSSVNINSDLDYVAILRGIWRRHKRLVVAIFLVVAVPSLTYVYVKSQTLYVSRGMISIEPSALAQLPFLRDAPRTDTIATHMVLLKSRSLSEAVIEALPKESLAELLAQQQHTDYALLLKNTVNRWLGKPLTVLSPQERALTELQLARMEFTPAKEAQNVFIITATATKPRVAMDLVNTHIQVLLNRARNVDQEEARKSRDFLESQYQQVKESLARSEETVTKLQQQKGRVRPGGQTEIELVRLAQLENSLAEAQAGRQVVSARIETLRRSVEQGRSKETKGAREGVAREDNGGAGGSLAADNLARMNAFKAAQEQLNRLEAKLASMRERYTEAHPLLQVTQEEVTRQQARVAQLARQLPASPSPRDLASPQVGSCPSRRTLRRPGAIGRPRARVRISAGEGRDVEAPGRSTARQSPQSESRRSGFRQSASFGRGKPKSLGPAVGSVDGRQNPRTGRLQCRSYRGSGLLSGTTDRVQDPTTRADGPGTRGESGNRRSLRP